MPIGLASFLVPKNGNTYFLLEDIYVKGGFQVVATRADLDSMLQINRKSGQVVFVADTQITYQLQEDLTTWRPVPDCSITRKAISNFTQFGYFNLADNYSLPLVVDPEVQYGKNYASIQAYQSDAVVDYMGAYGSVRLNPTIPGWYELDVTVYVQYSQETSGPGCALDAYDGINYVNLQAPMLVGSGSTQFNGKILLHYFNEYREQQDESGNTVQIPITQADWAISVHNQTQTMLPITDFSVTLKLLAVDESPARLNTAVQPS